MAVSPIVHIWPRDHFHVFLGFFSTVPLALKHAPSMLHHLFDTRREGEGYGERRAGWETWWFAVLAFHSRWLAICRARASTRASVKGRTPLPRVDRPRCAGGIDLFLLLRDPPGAGAHKAGVVAAAGLPRVSPAAVSTSPGRVAR